MIRITVPGQPIAKGRARAAIMGGKVRMFTPAKTVNYEGLIAHEGVDVMDGRDLLLGPLALTVFAYFQLPKTVSKARRALVAAGKDYHVARPDGDNVLKAVGDGLNSVVWRDDSQIASAQIVKMYSETPRLVIEVRPL